MAKNKIVPKLLPCVSFNGGIQFEYFCSCSCLLQKEYNYCPLCGAELAWSKILKPTKEYRETFEGTRVEE